MSDQDKTAMIGNELLRKRRAPHWIRVFRGVRNIHEDDGRWKGAYWTPVCLAALTFALGGDDPGVVVGTLRTRLLNFHQREDWIEGGEHPADNPTRQPTGADVLRYTDTPNKGIPWDQAQRRIVGTHETYDWTIPVPRFEAYCLVSERAVSRLSVVAALPYDDSRVADVLALKAQRRR